MYKYKRDGVKITVYKNKKKLKNIDWIATKGESIDSCLTGLRLYKGDAIQFGDSKIFKVKRLLKLKTIYTDLYIGTLIKIFGAENERRKEM